MNRCDTGVRPRAKLAHDGNFSNKSGVGIGLTTSSFSAGAILVGFGLIACLSSTARGIDNTTYTIDSVHSSAIFGVQHAGAGRFYGRFNDLSGTIKYADDSPSDLELDVSISVGSIDTASEQLDGHLKSPDFFNAKEFPSITFKSKSATKSADKMYTVQGDVTIHGVTKPITAQVEWLGTAKGRRGTRCGFEAILTIKRSEFGMNYGVEGGMIGNEIKIIVAMEAVSGGGGTNPRAGAAGGGGLPGRLADRDANKDGKIQKSEAPERMKQFFDEMDANKDGAVDAEEFRAARGRRGRGRRDRES